MSEEERLTLTASVIEDFEDELDSLETKLGEIDDEIRQTGGGEDKIAIDVEVQSGDALAELGTLQERIDNIDDEITIDVDVADDTVDDAVFDNEREQTLFTDLDDESFLNAQSRLRRLERDRRSTLTVDVDTDDILRDNVRVDTSDFNADFRDTETQQAVSHADAIDPAIQRQFDALDTDINISLDLPEDEIAAIETALDSLTRDRTVDVEIVTDESALLRQGVEISDEFFRPDTGSGTPFVERTGRGDERVPLAADDAIDDSLTAALDAIDTQLSDETVTLSEDAIDVDDTVTLSTDAVDLSDETVRLSEDAINLSDDTVTLSKDAVSLSDDTVTLSEDAIDVDDTVTLSEDAVDLSDETVRLSEDAVDLSDETVTADVDSEETAGDDDFDARAEIEEGLKDGFVLDERGDLRRETPGGGFDPFASKHEAFDDEEAVRLFDELNTHGARADVETESDPRDTDIGNLDVRTLTAHVTNANLITSDLTTGDLSDEDEIAQAIDNFQATKGPTATGDGGGGEEAVADGDDDGDGDLFTLDSIDEFEAEIEPFFDEGALTQRGGAAGRTREITTRPMGEIVDFEALETTVRSDETDLGETDVKGLLGFDGPEGFAEAIERINREDGEILQFGNTRDTRFTLENMGDFEETIGEFFDERQLAAEGGETDDVRDILNREIDDLVDVEQVIQLARDDDTDIDMGTVRGITGRGTMPDFIDAAEELDDVAPSATSFGREPRMRRLTRLTDEMRFTIGRFHEMFAAMVPIMGTFIGALPAAITAVGGLAVAAGGAAVALGAIGGLGLMGMSLEQTGAIEAEPILDQLRDVGAAFRDAFAPLARAFAPAVRGFIKELELMAVPLATASSALLGFRGAFRGFGQFLGDAIPSFTRDFLAFADAAMPIITGVLDTLAGIDIFGILARNIELALPFLGMLGKSLMNILPFVLQLSQGFLAFTGVFMGVVGVIVDLINTFPFLTRLLGVAIGGFLALTTAATLYNIAQTTTIGLAWEWAKTIGSVVVGALSKAATMYTALIGKIWAYFSSTVAATLATVALTSALTLGLAGALTAASTMFSNLTGNISDATKELRNFQNENISDRGPSFGQEGGMGASAVYKDDSTTVIDASGRDSAARQQYASEYERGQRIDSVFGGGA